MMNFNFNVSELIFILPELFLLSAISFILLFDLFVSEKYKKYSYHHVIKPSLLTLEWLILGQLKQIQNFQQLIHLLLHESMLWR